MKKGRWQKPAIFSWSHHFFIFAALVMVGLCLTGCTRRFFRRAADREAHAVLAEKDRVPLWRIDQFHVYPDPRARFAAPYRPDRPPMPPDDPAAKYFAPSPQKPRRAGVAWIEGDGYRQLLAQYNSENRALARLRKQKEEPSSYDGGIKQASYRQRPDQPAQIAERNEFRSTGKRNEFRSTGKRNEFRSTIIERKQKGIEVLPPPKEIGGKNGGKEVLPPPSELGCEPGGDICPADRQSYLINLEQAIELGLINSREFQTRREDLYLTALPVTLQRFAFAAQFFFTEQAVRERIGRKLGDGPANRWRFDSATGFTKLFSTGALLVLQFANQTVINLTGNRPHTVSISDINLDLAQPFLRGGGRAVTLEPLTQAERNLVYEIRNYARFRKEFYVAIAGGGNPAVGSLSSGVGGGVPVGSIAGLRSGRVVPGSAGRVILATGPGAQAVGYMPTLLAAAQLENQRKNVTALYNTLKKLQFFELAGEGDKLQTARFELQWLGGRSTVLQAEQNLRTSLDLFKIQLGIPPNTLIELDDDPIRPIKEHVRRYEMVYDLVPDIERKADNSPDISAPEKLRGRLRELLRTHPLIRGTRLAKNITQRWKKWEDSNDILIEKKLKALAEKKKKVERSRGKFLDLKAKLEGQGKQLPAEDQKQLTQLESTIGTLRQQQTLGEFEKYLRVFERRPWEKQKQPEKRLDTYVKSTNAVISRFLKIASEARDEQLQKLRDQWPELPPTVVDGFDLDDVELLVGQDVVARTALTERLDLMNAKAQVVDAWRQIAILANSLLGVFNVRYHMDSTTPPGEAKPLAFTGSRSRHQLILNAELPLVRKAERNAYRASLIGYERARRAFMAQQDAVVARVRQQIRQLQLLALNYKIQRQAVDVAYAQVVGTEKQLIAIEPPQPGAAVGAPRARAIAGLTRQLLDAYSSKLNAQNAVYSTWINYQVTRLQLFRDMGRMQLDSRGVFIDERTSNHQTSATGADQRGFQGNQPPGRLPEELAPPTPLPGARLGRPQ